MAPRTATNNFASKSVVCVRTSDALHIATTSAGAACIVTAVSCGTDAIGNARGAAEEPGGARTAATSDTENGDTSGVVRRRIGGPHRHRLHIVALRS